MPNCHRQRDVLRWNSDLSSMTEIMFLVADHLLCYNATSHYGRTMTARVTPEPVSRLVGRGNSPAILVW